MDCGQLRLSKEIVGRTVPYLHTCKPDQEPLLCQPKAGSVLLFTQKLSLAELVKV